VNDFSQFMKTIESDVIYLIILLNDFSRFMKMIESDGIYYDTNDENDCYLQIRENIKYLKEFIYIMPNQILSSLGSLMLHREREGPLNLCVVYHGCFLAFSTEANKFV
jgi:hypothetical protein